jgi:GDP-D-mannose dehydratase
MIESVTTAHDPSTASPERHALICGVTGQDGAYLARLLLGKGYEVTGTSRDAKSTMASL